ncbi:uncharacterized protein LOC108044933 isoform X2 [Drosophila rhopaloa]|uniref:RanBD1 domain-containing protein n=1 Tax=Drosophila rhopaloa TaxID=1041015 RepID=A0ABM5J3S9_DRORH|nr:uncharacterized protein LOC108044933 isoform X2 [Drosophila rhopaloa]
MLHNQVDGSNAVGQTEAIAVESLQSDVKIKCPGLNLQSSEGETTLPDLPTTDLIQQLESSRDESFEVDCSLPSLPLDTLLSPFNIIEQLRKQSEPFHCGFGELSFFGGPEPIESDNSKECHNTMPYFIPELEMACAGSEVEQIEGVTLAENEEPTAPEIKLPETELFKEPILAGINETNLHLFEEQNSTKLEEFKLPGIENINLPRIEESTLPGIEEINESKNQQPNSQEKQISPAELQPKSAGFLSPIALQIEELIAPLVEITKPDYKFGVISSLIGNKSTWSPSVRLSFGDRITRRTKQRSKEIIQQEASRSLKALILSVTMLKRLEESFNDNSYKNRLNRFERIKSSLNFSRVFRQNIFQLTSVAESSNKEIQDNSMACGEPMVRSPSIEPFPILYRLDASEGLSCNGLNVSKDSVFSEISESDESEVQNKLSLEEIRLTKTMADLADITKNGRTMFSQPVRLFCFNKLKEWKRQGEGQIEILEHRGMYYIILHDRVTGELIIYMRVDEKWRIDYMSNSSYSCRWTNINYASCRKGILERIACSFREPSHAAEFVARVRNSAIQSRFE